MICASICNSTHSMKFVSKLDMKAGIPKGGLSLTLGRSILVPTYLNLGLNPGLPKPSSKLPFGIWTFKAKIKAG